MRSRREAAGLSQADLAALTGIRQPNISAYESGRRRPSPRTLQRLLDAVAVRPSDLLERHRDEIVEVVRNRSGEALWVFGSSARSADTTTSDLDLLVRFGPGASLLDQAGIVHDLEEMLGIHVDVVSVGGLRPGVHDDIARDAVLLWDDAA